MNENNFIDIIENMSTLKDSSLNDFYEIFYENNFNKNERCWTNENDEEFMSFVRLLENRCINNFKKFQILSIISHDLGAFKLLQDNSKILKNDEEITAYFDFIKNIYENVEGRLYEKLHHLEMEMFSSIIPRINEHEEKIRGFDSFKDMYENYDRHTLKYCKEYVDEHRDF